MTTQFVTPSQIETIVKSLTVAIQQGHVDQTEGIVLMHAIKAASSVRLVYESFCYRPIAKP